MLGVTKSTFACVGEFSYNKGFLYQVSQCYGPIEMNKFGGNSVQPCDTTFPVQQSIVVPLCVCVLHAAAILFGCPQSSCCAHTLQSPNGRIELSVNVAEEDGRSELQYAVAFDNNSIVEPSTISFATTGGDTIGTQLRDQGDVNVSSHDSTWKPVYGERSSIRDNYRQLCLILMDSATGHAMRVEFRCYDAGVAFRATIEAPHSNELIEVAEELTEFRFPSDYLAWRTTEAQGSYSKVPLSKLGKNVERPLVVELEQGIHAAVAEAGLVDYAPMMLRRAKSDPHCLISQLGGSVRAKGKLVTPWRVIMLGNSAGELLEQNDLILNLNQPCAIADTSWIKPGKVLREISLTTDGAKACIDFAARNNFQYIEFDAGWYGHEYDEASDATTISLDERRSQGPLDLHWAIEYAKQRDIGVIVYVNRRALEKQLDEILPLYKKWGIAGVKYGFVNTGTQEWTTWLHEAVRKAADHELMVDIHDVYRPTGYSRTYPNLMTQEGVRGDEATPSGSQAVTTLFTRNLAGAADHTICYFASRVKREWSHGHQLAKAVCTYSPWQFMYWYDSPLTLEQDGHPSRSRIIDTPELEFFAKVPTVWDDTQVVSGVIGGYATVARRSGQDWFVGALNGGEERQLEVPLDFLSPNVTYTARRYSDDPTLETTTQVRIDELSVDSRQQLNVALQPNGGQAIWLTPTESSTSTASDGLQLPHTASKATGELTE